MNYLDAVWTFTYKHPKEVEDMVNNNSRYHLQELWNDFINKLHRDEQINKYAQFDWVCPPNALLKLALVQLEGADIQRHPNEY